MRQSATFIILLIMSIFNLKGAAPKDTPDFAYPETVAKTSLAALNKAVAHDDAPQTVRYAVQYALSQTITSDDNLPALLERLRQLRDKATSPAAKAMLDLLRARIYVSAYNDNRWTYDRRDLPMQPMPDDYRQWSAAQFAITVDSLLTSALSHSDVLLQTPVSDYSQSITMSRDEAIYYPTLLDFVLLQAIDMTRDLEHSRQSILPEAIMSADDFDSLTANTTLTDATRRLIGYYNRRVDIHPAHTPARLMAAIERLRFVRSLIYASSTDHTINDLYNSALTALYDADSDAGWSLCALTDLNTNVDTKAKADIYEILVTAARQHTDATLTPNIREMAANLSAPDVQINADGIVARAHDTDISIAVSNVADLSLNVYRITGHIGRDESMVNIANTGHTLYRTIPIDLGQRPTIYTDTLTAGIAFDSYGLYAIQAIINGKPAGNHLRVIRCTDMALVKASIADDTRAVVVNNTTGAPLKDVNIEIYSGGYRKEGRFGSLTTDADGFARLTKPEYGNIYPTLGDDRYAPSVHYYLGDKPTDHTELASVIYTDLPLYHQGDTLRGVAVTYSYDAESRHVLAGTEIEVILRDVNYQEVKRLTLTTDGYGRAQFEFTLPDSGLTGDYTLATTCQGSITGNRTIPVSDYKLPTYEAVIDSISGNMQTDGRVTLSGHATYYSGFPVADARIAVSLCCIERTWWRRQTTPQFYAAEITTDAEGRFELTVDSAVAALSPITRADIEATFTITAANGETCIVRASFATGKPYVINTTTASDILASDHARVAINATDAMGHEANIPVIIDILDGDTVVSSIAHVTPVNTLNLSSLASGTYTMAVRAQTSDDADDAQPCRFVLYRSDDTVCPTSSPLWIPRRTYTVNADSHSASIIYGTDRGDAHILVTVARRGAIERMYWVNADAGQHTLDVAVDDRQVPTIVTIARVLDGQLHESTVTLRPTELYKSITMSINAFRDKVIAGATERWSISISADDSTPAPSALMMTVYCKALITLANQPWVLTPRTVGYPTPGISMRQYDANSYFGLPTPDFKTVTIGVPELNTYGRTFSGMRIYGYRMMKSAMNTAAAFEYDTEDCVVEECADEVEVPMMAGKTGDLDAGSYDTVTSGIMVEDTPTTNPPAESYRESEIASALFAPMLTTGDDGTLQMTFDVPDANTAWQVNAIAYTTGLLTDDETRTIVASKPVMVNPNLPRFVRRGDTVDILASVMNNSDADADIRITVEIVNPVDGSIIVSSDDTLPVDASSSATICTTLTADADVTALLYRVRAATDTFSDGEQSLLPILEASQPVIDAKPFYIAPGDTEFSTAVAGKHADSQVTLQLCQNIAWEVVTALPGVRSDDMQTANAAIARIFSASVARGLMRDNPGIAAAIREWTASDRSDSTLTSMLSRNDDLKMMMLSSTPCVRAAANDTERMQQLVLLFDNKLIDKTISADIALLSRLASPSGGWRWMSGYDAPSLWTTYNVLECIAELKRLGYLPDDRRLASMTENALTYIDNENVNRYRRSPKDDYTYYAWLRTQLSNPAPSTAAQRVIDSAVRHAIDGWRDDDLCGKALDAILLAGAGYRNTASQILASLRQYATVRPDKGMYWPRLAAQNRGWGHQVAATSILLDAFAQVEPKCADIDLIRQWMIVNKTTQDWGSGIQTTQIIASILGSGTDWNVEPAGLAVTVDGHQLAIPDSDRRTGYFTADITSMLGEGDGTLDITRAGGYPSFGAVIDRYTGIMRQTAAHSCDELSVTKRHLVRRGTQWVESDSVHVGDIVKISLTLTVSQGLDYVAIIDNRAACLEPVEQLPAPIYAEGLCFYRENRDSATNIFIDRLPVGVYILEYEMKVNNAGSFASGLATAQSQYAPSMTAHSAGTVITSLQ